MWDLPAKAVDVKQAVLPMRCECKKKNYIVDLAVSAKKYTLTVKINKNNGTQDRKDLFTNYIYNMTVKEKRK